MIEALPLRLTNTLAHFNIHGSLGTITDGPLVTEVEFLLREGSKFTTVEKLAKDIGRELGVTGVRVTEILNSPYICFEIPLPEVKTVDFLPLVYSSEFIKANYALPVCLGVDMRGTPVMKDLSKMPHLLVAGTTGSGKSVGLNSFIVSLIQKKTPQQLQLILIDPKRIEFSIYNNQQYMQRPVITDMNLASIALSQLVAEMNDRYTLFEQQTVRNIEEYNTKGKMLPYIVCIIDEFADLVMFDKEVEKLVQTLAQKSRAAGIHLIIATQRPSVDVITGSIKANLPTRLSYKVASTADSMTILNTGGAENLRGRGDSLFLEENGTLTRILGAYISNDEISNILQPYRCTIKQPANIISRGHTTPQKTVISTQKAADNPEESTSLRNRIIKFWNNLGKREQKKVMTYAFNALKVCAVWIYANFMKNSKKR